MLTTLFVPLAIKSAIIAAAAMGVLRMARNLSPARRSWIAHFALAALVALPLATILLPRLEVVGPAAMFAAPEPALPAIQATAAPAPSTDVAPMAAASDTPSAAPLPSGGMLDAVDATLLLYAAPALLLLGLTLVALLRLATLQHRAQVLVEPHWLSALAQAQRRMGFKHGTALLSSDELTSPISWGLVRPVIVLNQGALNASSEAEAIIAHELAHVAHFDWLKLLLARVAVALFWFNPFVWLLAREAHQLREESADDAVLGSDVDDADYAQLLVGFARHDGRGALIAAHGVAPSSGSLMRRVQRVLDRNSVRGPVGWRWAAAAFVAGAATAGPLTALVLVPQTSKALAAAADTSALGTTDRIGRAAGTGAAALTTIGAAAATAVHPHPVATIDGDEDVDRDTDIDIDVDGPDIDIDIDRDALKELGRVARLAGDSGSLVAARIHGVTPEYREAIAAAAPQWRQLNLENLTAFRIHKVTPEFIRGVRAAGYPGVTADQVLTARVHRMDMDYVRAMRSTGMVGNSFDELIALKVHGVRPDEIGRRPMPGKRKVAIASNGRMVAMAIGEDGEPDPDPDPDPDDERTDP